MILMNDFGREDPDIRSGMQKAANRVLASGWYVLGNEVKAFESAWAQACGVSHCVGVGNGMDAIEISLRAIGIGAGDEVITTPMTAFASVLAIVRAGAVPILADVHLGSGQMSLESAARCVTPNTKAVLLVHLYGQIRDINKWTEFCSSRGLELIEDCAQAHLASVDGKAAGSFGRAGAYSFYPTKNLGAIGDAGMLVTNDAQLAACAERLRNYGQSKRYYHSEIGMNSRLDELQAALLRERMNWLQEFTDRRRAIAQKYALGIRNPAVIKLSQPQHASAHVFHLYVVRTQQRDTLQAYLLEKQIQTLIHYPVPVHMQQPCRTIRRDPAGLSNSEEFAATCLSLPCHPQLSDDETVQVIEAVNSFGAA